VFLGSVVFGYLYTIMDAMLLHIIYSCALLFCCFLLFNFKEIKTKIKNKKDNIIIIKESEKSNKSEDKSVDVEKKNSVNLKIQIQNIEQNLKKKKFKDFILKLLLVLKFFVFNSYIWSIIISFLVSLGFKFNFKNFKIINSKINKRY
jgi:hypothetical protein